MTLTVHHLQVSQSERIVWLCEELGISYKLVLYKRDPLLSPPDLKKLTHMGAAPVIQDTAAPYSESQPLTLAESQAIVEYIVQKYGEGRFMLPPSHKDYADYLYWWYFSNIGLQGGISRLFQLHVTKPDRNNPMVERIYEKLPHTLQFIDERLSKNTWLAGDEFTVADIMSVFSLTTMRQFHNYSLADYPGILAYLQRVGERPAYKSAMQKGDPGMGPFLGADSPPLFGPIAKLLG